MSNSERPLDTKHHDDLDREKSRLFGKNSYTDREHTVKRGRKAQIYENSAKFLEEIENFRNFSTF